MNASEANGYENDTWIGVPVSVRDYNRETIIYGTEEFKPATFSLSSTTVQVMILYAKYLCLDGLFKKKKTKFCFCKLS